MQASLLGHQFNSVQSLSRVRLFATLCDPMDYSTPGFPVYHQLPELAQTHVLRVGDAINHLILCHPLPSIFPSIRVFSNDSALHIRWPEYWSFSIGPSNEYSGLISFRIDWFALLAVQGILNSLPQNIGASAPASVFPRNIQALFPLGLVGFISLHSKELSSLL